MRRLRPLFALSFALALPAWAAPPEASGEDLLGRTVFQVLIGELALREGAVDLSLQAWVDLAQRTREATEKPRRNRHNRGRNHYASTYLEATAQPHGHPV